MPCIISFYVFKSRHDAERAMFVLNESGFLNQKVIIFSNWNPKKKYSDNDSEWKHSLSSTLFSVLYYEIVILFTSSLTYLDASLKLINFRFRISNVMVLIVESFFILFCVSIFSQLLIKLSAFFLYHIYA